MKVFVIVPAAGLGTRMAPPSAAKSKKKAPSKQFKELGGVPILVHTLRKFAATPAIYEIIVALRKDEIAGFRTQVEKAVPGNPEQAPADGRRRRASAGLSGQRPGLHPQPIRRISCWCMMPFARSSRPKSLPM